MWIPSFGSSLSLGRFERVSCDTWIFTPFHPSLPASLPLAGKPPASALAPSPLVPNQYRLISCPFAEVTETGLINYFYRCSLKCASGTSENRLWPFFFPLPNFVGGGGSESAFLCRDGMRWSEVRGSTGVPAGLLPPVEGEMLLSERQVRETWSRRRQCWPRRPWPPREGIAPALPVLCFRGSGRGRWQKSHLCQPWSLPAAVEKHRHIGVGGFQLCTIISGSTGLLPPLPRVKAEPKPSDKALKSSQLLCLPPCCSKTLCNVNCTTRYFITWKMLALQRAHLKLNQKFNF